MPEPSAASRIHRELFDGRCYVADVDEWDAERRVVRETKAESERTQPQDKWAWEALKRLAQPRSRYPLYVVRPDKMAFTFEVALIRDRRLVWRRTLDQAEWRKEVHALFDLGPEKEQAALPERSQSRRELPRWFVCVEGRGGQPRAVCIWLGHDDDPVKPDDPDYAFFLGLCAGESAVAERVVGGRVVESTDRRCHFCGRSSVFDGARFASYSDYCADCEANWVAKGEAENAGQSDLFDRLWAESARS